MRCRAAGCARPAEARLFCHLHYERQRYRERTEGTREAKGYPRDQLAWDVGEFDRLYAETPAAAWAGLFWQDMSIRAGRTYFALYQYAKRHERRAKVDPRLRASWRELGNV